MQWSVSDGIDAKNDRNELSMNFDLGETTEQNFVLTNCDKIYVNQEIKSN